MSVRLHRHPSAEAFLARVQPALLVAEAENNLLLGTAGDLALPLEGPPEPPYLASLESAGKVDAAAVLTPPFPLLVSRAGRPALEALACDLAEAGATPLGVLAPAGVAEAFAELWARWTSATLRPGMGQRIYELDRVRPPAPAPPGHLRPAGDADLELVLEWFEAFAEDAGMAGTISRRMARQKVEDGRVFLWQDTTPVSMAAWAGRTANGARVNFVYTPPDLRGRGYASVCVAALSQHLLDTGCKLCFLFTDPSNPTSNRIYQRLGYRYVGNVEEVLFAAGGKG